MDDKQPKPNQPAAYDSKGRPLYYQSGASAKKASLVGSKPDGYEGHNYNPKLRTQYANEPDFIHAKREHEPSVLEISEALKRKHDESVRLFPFLNLSEGEFVVLRISRHPIGLLIPVFFTSLAVIILSAFLFLTPDFYDAVEESAYAEPAFLSQEIIVSILMLLMLASIGLGAASVWIYQKNQFFLTNESVIQQIQHSLFSHREQTVSLGSIEDASFRRQGILQYIFNYGTMRLSTEGEETTYRFAFVENPKEQIAIVSNAVEAFKNGRPVGDD